MYHACYNTMYATQHAMLLIAHDLTVELLRRYWARHDVSFCLITFILQHTSEADVE